MRAVQITEYGDFSVLRFNNVPDLTPTGSQVLVSVRAAALNPLDAVLVAGHLQTFMPLQFPATLGGDVSGVIVAMGPDVQIFNVGDRVYGNAYTLLGNSGALAQQALVESRDLAQIPETVSFTEAAAIPVAGTTAVEAITHSLQLKRGQRVFISGGSGAVGFAAIQLAKHIGAHVATSASGDGVALATEAGADQVFDYTREDFSEHLFNFDAVLDVVGGDSLEKSYKILRPGGTLVSLVGDVNQDRSNRLGITAIRQAAQSEGVLRDLTVSLAARIITPRVGKIFDLDDAAAAFQAMVSREVRGKIVILP